MATQDFNLSYTVEIPALFNEPPIGKQGAAGTIFADLLSDNSKQGAAGTIFADVVTLDKQGAAGTIFAELAVLEKSGPATQFDLLGLCIAPSTMSPPGTSTLSSGGVGGGQTNEASCP